MSYNFKQKLNKRYIPPGEVHNLLDNLQYGIINSERE